MPGSTLLLIAALWLGQEQAQPTDPLLVLRQLYAAADYEAALAEAERLAGNADDSRRLDLERYRALCYLALGRVDRAEAAIEHVFRTDPAYEPDEEEPPRVRAAFASVRVRVLPEVVRATYAEAKAHYERKQYADAISGFERALGILDSIESSDPALADLRTLTTGFLDLSRAASALAASAPPVTPAPSEPSPPSEPPPPAPTPTSIGEAVPPVAISQVLPPWNPASFGSQYQSEFRGAVEVTIDENGAVVAAKIVEPIHPAYDPLMIEAATRWRYVPARLDGRPVASTKRVDVILRPRD
jgi:tetratricopeptide (TPR) repeat protein